MPFWYPRNLATRYGLRLALLAYVVAPLVVTFGVFWALALTQFERLSERRLQEEIELVARAIHLPLSRAIDDGRSDQLRRSLESAQAIDRVYGAYVYNKEGDLILAVGRRPEQHPAAIRDIAASGDRVGEYGELQGRRIFAYFVPLTDIGGRVNGVLQVTRRRRDFDEHVAALRRQALAALTLCAAVMTGVVFWGHHHALGNPVQRLARVMKEAGRSERRQRATVEGPEEVRTLAVSLNSMLDGIEQRQNELADHQRDRAALERRLYQAEKMAAIGVLAAGVAHEIGTPLSVIDGHAQRLQRNDSLPDGALRSVRQIRAHVRRVEDIIGNLLDIGSSRGRHPQTVEASRAVSRCCNSLADFAAAHDVDLQLEIGGDASVRADLTTFDQAVANIIRNAVQAAPGGKVRVRTAVADQRLTIAVEDDGPGVPEEVRARIFEPFFTTKPVGQGSGVGLALAQRAVQDAGGTIRVRSSEWGGARFDIVLPTVDELDEDKGEG